MGGAVPHGPDTANEPGAPRQGAPSSLWRNRDFRTFLGGQGVSAFGDSISFTALPLLVIALTGSGVAMGIVGVLTTLPDLFFGLPAGALADRWDRRRMMLYADLGRAALTALIPLSFIVGIDTMAVVLLVTAPINLLRVIFMAGFTAAVPNLVAREQIGRATGVVEGLFSLTFIVGPAIAGVLSHVVGPGPTIALDAASFLFSAGALTLVRKRLQADRRDDAERPHIVSDIVEGVRYIAGQRTLRTVIAFWGVASIASAPLVPAVIFYLAIDRGQSSDVVGTVVSAYGVGYFIGAILAGRSAATRLGAGMLVGNAASGLALIAFATAGTVPLELAASAAAGVTGSVVLISYLTLRATIPPDELLGRVGSTARTISLGLQPIGLFAGGILLDAIGGRMTILIIAGAILAVTGLFAFSPTLRGAVAGTGQRHA